MTERARAMVAPPLTAAATAARCLRLHLLQRRYRFTVVSRRPFTLRHRAARPLAVAALLLALPGALAAAPPAGEGWLDDLAAARARARQQGKPILVDLWADWCTWCKRLERDVFSTPVFREYARGFVLLRVDTEDDGDGARLKRDFEVESLPTTLILSADLVKIGALQGFAPPEPYVQSLELERALYASLVDAYERRVAHAGADGEPANGSDQDGGGHTLQALADELHSRRDGRRAAALYRELVARGDDNPEEDAWNRYYLADSLRLAGELEQARTVAKSARATTGAIDNVELGERIELLSYYLARDAGACSEARRALDGFVARHPQGVLVELARSERHALDRDRSCR